MLKWKWLAASASILTSTSSWTPTAHRVPLVRKPPMVGCLSICSCEHHVVTGHRRAVLASNAGGSSTRALPLSWTRSALMDQRNGWPLTARPHTNSASYSGEHRVAVEVDVHDGARLSLATPGTWRPASIGSAHAWCDHYRWSHLWRRHHAGAGSTGCQWCQYLWFCSLVLKYFFFR